MAKKSNLAGRFRVRQAQRARLQMPGTYGVGKYGAYLGILRGGKK